VEAMTAPAHHLMCWHHLCVLWLLLWTYTATSLHNGDGNNGNDGGAASRGNDSASASNDALASPLWTYTTASLHNGDGNDRNNGGAASGGNDGASASFNALALPLRPLVAAVDVLRHLSAQRRWE
jgi:hypothetical protein